MMEFKITVDSIDAEEYKRIDEGIQALLQGRGLRSSCTMSFNPSY